MQLQLRASLEISTIQYKGKQISYLDYPQSNLFPKEGSTGIFMYQRSSRIFPQDGLEFIWIYVRFCMYLVVPRTLMFMSTAVTFVAPTVSAANGWPREEIVDALEESNKITTGIILLNFNLHTKISYFAVICRSQLIIFNDT